MGDIKTLALDADPNRDFHIALWNDAIIGFFKIDRSYADTHAFAKPSGYGLRSFLIWAEFQGKGYGRSLLKALPGYLSAQYPDQDCYYLTVNMRNASAYNLYLRSGWIDDGDLYHGGSAGPQHILSLCTRP